MNPTDEPVDDTDAPRTTLVVNPNAAKGTARLEAPLIAERLAKAWPGTYVDVHLASSFEDARVRATEVAQQARAADASGHSPDRLVMMGGDGMAHLGLNACAGTPVPLGIIPAGTGNDFCRSVGLPSNTASATLALGHAQPRRIDLMRVGAPLDPRRPTRFVGCTVSSGYDAMVSQAVRDAKYKFGPLTYVAVALRELARFTPINYALEIDGVARHERAMLVAVSNGSYFGGGMKIAPSAVVDDGLLEVTIVHPVGRGTFLRLLPELYSGSFVRVPQVEIVRAKSVRVGGANLLAEGDGEVLGATPVQIDCQPGAVAVLAPPSAPALA